MRKDGTYSFEMSLADVEIADELAGEAWDRRIEEEEQRELEEADGFSFNDALEIAYPGRKI